MNKPTTVKTGEVRISYEHLLKPYASKVGAEAKYSCTILVPKSDMATKQAIDTAIQAAIQEGVSGKWGGTRPAQPPTPVYDGDGLRLSGEAFGEECRGHWVMTASSKLQQEIVDASLQPIMNATEIYSGMYARVQINFFAYNAAGKKGIGCGLGPVMKLRDGEPLGGKVTATEAFGGGAPAYPQSAPVYSQPQTAQPQYAQPVVYSPPQILYPPQINPITGLPL